MRSGIIGFILGVLMMGVALVLLQQRVIREVKNDLSFQFDRYVFDGPNFPTGDFDQGRLIHRLLFPTPVTTIFYDAQYQEVKHADKPGRYGAVVRLSLNGNRTLRFITLYRTPARVFWSTTPWPMSVQVPAEMGLDPAVLRNQESEITEMLKSNLVGLRGDSPNLAILLAGLSETSPGDPPAVYRTNVIARDVDWWDRLRLRLGLAPQYTYLLNLPRDYDRDPARRWPLLLYLTTGAESGDDLDLVRRSGLIRQITAGRQIPAIVLSPQCPVHEDWSPRELSRLLDDIAKKYRVDPDRVVVSGGSGAWSMAVAYPERFAAAVPIYGDSDPADAARLGSLPVWAFHGAEEENVPASRTIETVDAIRKAGGHPHLTLSDGSYDGWDAVYATDAVYTWLFAQKRGQPEVLTPGLPSP